MSINFEEIGRRLRVYRRGSGLRPEELARKLGVSRAAVYRLEAGEVVKVDTLIRIAEVLETSVASLLGVGVEYYPNPVSFFERMRQLEGEAERVVAHFEPVSYLLTTDEYTGHLHQALVEALPKGLAGSRSAAREIDALVDVLRARKSTLARRPPSIVSIIGETEIERFLELGLVGHLQLPPEIRALRRAAARVEMINLCELIDREPMGVQIGVFEDALPHVTFQLFYTPRGTYVAASPFRLGELPNIRYGVAIVTPAAEGVKLYESLADDLWRRSLKGPAAADLIRQIIIRQTASREAAPAALKATR
ncbi:MAG: helix-turn-helix domain-containing protein [Alphaproteobacteria bacterium]